MRKRASSTSSTACGFMCANIGVNLIRILLRQCAAECTLLHACLYFSWFNSSCDCKYTQPHTHTYTHPHCTVAVAPKDTAPALVRWFAGGGRNALIAIVRNNEICFGAGARDTRASARASTESDGAGRHRQNDAHVIIHEHSHGVCVYFAHHVVGGAVLQLWEFVADHNCVRVCVCSVLRPPGLCGFCLCACVCVLAQSELSVNIGGWGRCRAFFLACVYILCLLYESIHMCM